MSKATAQLVLCVFMIMGRKVSARPSGVPINERLKMPKLRRIGVTTSRAMPPPIC